jgi:hypothetical protein
MKISTCILFIFLFISPQSIFSQGEPSSSPGSSQKVTPKPQQPKYVKMILRSAPTFTLQLSGSYNQGIYELSGNDNGDFNSMEFINGKNFGVRHGYGGNITAKIPLHKKGNIRLNITAMYNKFSSKLNKIATGTQEPGFANYNVISGSIGLENNFTPSYRFKTLVGASFMASVISGNARVIENYVEKNLSIKPAFRLGASLFTGFEYLLNDRLGFNLGYQYVQANVWLKNSKESSDKNSIYLNDKRVNPKLPYSGWKQFAFGSFYGGINIYFGITQKYYVLKNFIK